MLLAVGWTSASAAENCAGGDTSRFSAPGAADSGRQVLCLSRHRRRASRGRSQARRARRGNRRRRERTARQSPRASPNESELIRRIDVEGDERMPPDTAKKPLSDQEPPRRYGSGLRQGAEYRPALGIHRAGSTRSAGDPAIRRGREQRFGPVCAGPSRGGGTRAFARGRPGHAAPPAERST